MYLLQKFDRDGFEHINGFIDALNGFVSDHVCLIASSCYPFPEVLQALSSPFDLVPFEGFANAQYFPGEEIAVSIERYADDLLRDLAGYGPDYACTTQPHSGTQANQIVYNAVLAEGDVVLSMEPASGGHISHRVLVGRRNRAFHYGVDSNGLIDYEQVLRLAKQHRPKLIIGGASSYPREIDFDRLREIADEVGARLHADLSHMMIFQISGHHRSVFPAADFVTFSPVKNMRGPGGGILIYRRALESQVATSVFPGTQGGPHVDIMFAKAVCLRCLSLVDRRQYGDLLIANAQAMAEALKGRGYEVVTGGTDSHIVLADLRTRQLSGLDAEKLCESYRLLVNRNAVPGDTRPPRITSGLRMGSACITNLGAEPGEAAELGQALADCLEGAATSACQRLEGFRTRFMSSLISPVR